MDYNVFSVSGFDVTIFQILLCIAVIIVGLLLYTRLRNISFVDGSDTKLSKLYHRAFQGRLALSIILVVIMAIIRIVNYDIVIFRFNDFSITIHHLTEIFSLVSIALLIDWIISHMVIRNRFNKREIPVRTTFENNKVNETKATKLVRYIVYLYIIQILIKRINADLIIMQRELKGELFTVHISDVMIAVIIMLTAKVLVWFFTQITLYRMYRRNDMDEGIQYAINQLVTYVVYVFAFLFALDRIVSDMSIIYGGGAALLVGVGLGLQQTFNDFFSGLVLLFERSVMVGDILELEGQVGRVLKIGLRASRIETRNSVSMLVPNSKLVNQSVTNWTHYDNIVRFQVDISFAYGTDTETIKNLLLEAASSVERVMDTPPPFVRLNDFGAHGLQYTLYFFSTFVMWAEDVRSDVRVKIEKMVRDKNLVIPFPQQDIWFRNQGKNNVSE